MKSQDNDNKKFTIQTISLTLAGLLGSAVNGIVAYIAVYFFKPLWEKIVAFLQKKP
jgi:hypothetical protein